MTFDQFNEFQEKLLAEVVAMKDTKGREYANSESRFANFDRLAEELGIPNYQIGWIYCKKHLDAIANYCKEGKSQSEETIRGRFVDAITYLTLIAGMVEEKDKITVGPMFSQLVSGVLEPALDQLFKKGDKVYYIPGEEEAIIEKVFGAYNTIQLVRTSKFGPGTLAAPTELRKC